MSGSEFTRRVIQRVAELPDRTSPDDWPEAMLVTAEELDRILVEERDRWLTDMTYARTRLPEQLVAMQHARNQLENMARERFWLDIGRPADPEPDVDEDLIRLGSDFQ